MFPNRSRLAIAPFSDPSLYNDMASRSVFWRSQDFYGVNLTSAAGKAMEEQFRQPIVDYIDTNILVAPCHIEEFDFTTISRSSLENIVITCQFHVSSPCLIHGLAGWFDVLCEGSDQTLGFSTSPWCAPTHWYQIRFLLQQPVAVNPGQIVLSTLTMEANIHQSYYIRIRLQIAGTNIISESALIDLKDPDYRYYTNPTASYYPQAAPPTQVPGQPAPSNMKPASWGGIVDSDPWRATGEPAHGQCIER